MGTLIFQHHQKTGGTTLRTVIARNYDQASIHTMTGYRKPGELKTIPESVAKFLLLSARKREKIKVVVGDLWDMVYKIGAHVSPPTAYITMFRDPIDRVISQYYFILRSPTYPTHGTIISKRLSLVNCVTSGLLEDNMQTRGLSGMNPPFNQCPWKMLEMATRNLRQRFAAFGLTERYDESLILFKALFGWKNICYRKENITPARPHRRDIPKDALKAIQKHNELDLELYEYAKDLFNRRIELQEGTSFRRELDILKFLNTQYPKYCELQA